MNEAALKRAERNFKRRKALKAKAAARKVAAAKTTTMPTTLENFKRKKVSNKDQPRVTLSQPTISVASTRSSVVPVASLSGSSAATAAALAAAVAANTASISKTPFRPWKDLETTLVNVKEEDDASSGIPNSHPSLTKKKRKNKSTNGKISEEVHASTGSPSTASLPLFLAPLQYFHSRNDAIYNSSDDTSFEV